MAADLTDHRDRQRPPPTSLGALLEPRRLVALGVDLDAMAVTDGREEFTWSEYGHAARTVARHLAAAGVRPGERVAIRLPKSAWSFVAVHGVLAAGAIVVPIDPLAPLEHAATTLHEADVAAVIVDHRVRATAELLGRVGPAAVLVPEGSSTWAAEHLTDRTWRRFDADEIHDPPDEADDRADGGDDPRDGTDDRADQVDEPGDGTDDAPAAGDVDGGSERPAGAGGDGSSEDDAYIVFTSGSTGVPKGIVHTHASALAYARAAVAEYGVGPGDRLLNIAGLHFDQSTFELYAGPLGGAAVIVVPDATLRFPASVVDLAADRGATVVYTVPHVLTQLVDRGGATAERLADLRLVKYGGSSFPPGDLRRLVDALGEVSVSNVYGPAEVNQCTVHAVTTPVGDDDVPIGGAWAAARLRLAERDDPSVPLAADESIGRLLVASDTMMRAYWRRPDLTAERILELDGERWYDTGDVVERGPDGLLRFVGRVDNQVKIRGQRVELEVVDAALAAVGGVATAATVVIDGDDGPALVGVVVAEPGSAIDERAVVRAVAAALPAAAVPAKIVTVAALPRTSSGKVDRDAVAELIRTA